MKPVSMRETEYIQAHAASMRAIEAAVNQQAFWGSVPAAVKAAVKGWLMQLVTLQKPLRAV